MEGQERSQTLNQESAQQVQALKQEVMAKSSDQLKTDFFEAAAKAVEIRRVVEINLRREQTVNISLEGTKDDKNSLKGKAIDVKQAVQKILLTGKTPGKIPTPQGTPVPEQTRLATSLIQKMSEKIDPERVEISEAVAPYLYQILQKTLEGKITDIHGLEIEFNKIDALQIISPGIYQQLQDAFVDLAVENNYEKSIALEKFKVVEDKTKRFNPRTGATEEMPVIFEPGELDRLHNLSYRIYQSTLKPQERDELFDLLREGIVNDWVKEKLNQVKIDQSELPGIVDLAVKSGKYTREFGGTYPGLDNFFPPEERRKFTYEYLIENKYLTKDGLNVKGKHALRKAALRAVNLLFKKADDEPGVEFEKNFSEFHEGYYFRDIKQIIESLQKDTNLIMKLGGIESEKYREVTQWIKQGLAQEVGREKELRTLYHNVGIWIKLMDPKQVAEHMARHNVSETTSVLLSDMSGKLVSLAMTEYERYIGFDIGINGGKVRPNLFSGKVNPNELYYSEKDRNILRERFIHTIQGLKKYAKDELSKVVNADGQRLKDVINSHDLTQYDLDGLEGNFEDWEIDRAIKYARGIHLTQSLRGFEIPASAKPYKDYVGSAEGFYNMIANINPSWKWNLGRGAPGTRYMHAKEVLVAEGLVRKPKESLLARIFDTSWNPKKIHDEVEAYSEGKMAEKWQNIKDSWLYKDMSFRQLLSKFGIGGLGGRAGWRLVGFKDTPFEKYISGLQEVIEEQLPPAYKKASWEQKYQMLAQVAGVGTRFWMDSDRAKDYVKELLWEKLKIDKDKVSSADLNKLWAQHTTGDRGDRIMFNVDGQEMTVLDYVEAKMTVYEGENFYALLKRSPIDFLNNFLNLTPYQLTAEKQNLMTWVLPKGLAGDDGSPDYYFLFGGTKDDPKIIDEKSLRDYLNNFCDPITGEPIIGKAQNDAVYETLLFQRGLKKTWGENNFKHIGFIREFYKGLNTWAEHAKDEHGQLKFYKSGKFDKEEFLDFYYRELDLASEKVKLRHGEVMEPEDIENAELRDFFFGDKDKGLITYFNNLHEDFGNDFSEDFDPKTGKEGKLGGKDFFYHMARTWYNESGVSLHPNTSDVDWRYVFHNLGERAGENIVVRLWSDMAAWNEVTNGLINLDHMFRDAAEYHSLDKIIEFQMKMHELEGVCGKDEMYEKQYYFTQLVIRYFQEHPATRLPFPISSIYSLINGKELSLSRIYNGRTAMVLSTDGINSYLQKLRNLQIIQPKGQYGFDRLAKSMGADWSKLLIAEIIPDIAIMLAMFLLWKFISQSLKEAEGGKK